MSHLEFWELDKINVWGFGPPPPPSSELDNGAQKVRARGAWNSGSCL